MSETIGSVCSRFSSGKPIKTSDICEDGKYPVYGGNGLRGFSNEYNFEGECAIIGRQGAYCGNVRYFIGKAYMTEHAIVAVPSKGNDARFLAYKLGMMNLFQYQGQSAQPGLSVNMLAKVEINLPDIEEQERVVEVLREIENKIENNNKINAELESLAKTIYDYWFLQFDFPNEEGKPYKSSGGKMVWNEELKREIPLIWKQGCLKDFFVIGNGKDYKSLNCGNVPIYGSGGRIGSVGSYLYDDESVLIPRKGTLNNIMYVNERFWTVDTMYYTIMKVKHCAKYVYYTCKLFDYEQMNTGTGVPSMTSSIIYSLKCVVPDGTILEKFDSVLQPIFQRIKKAEDENQELSQLRDFLLPMLMNGQVGFR